MGIRLTQKLEEANALTHGGIFHADEVFATAILSKVMDVVLVRQNEVPEPLPEGILVYDIGNGKYDHHQKDKPTRENGMPYAACGLVWKDFGQKALLAMGCPEEFVPRVWSAVDKGLILGIDVEDNGLPVIGNSNLAISMGMAISFFNPCWDEEELTDGAFLEAVEWAAKLMERKVRRTVGEASANLMVEKAIEDSEDHVMVLPGPLPWKANLVLSKNPKAGDIWYVVFPSNRGGYICQSAPVTLRGFDQRHLVPKAWWGASAQKLPELTGIKDVTFVHHTGFLACIQSMEGAIAYAHKAASM